MAINPRVEETFRTIIGHTVRNEPEELEQAIAQAGQEVTGQVIALAIRAAGHVAVYAAERWPNDADLKEVARVAWEARTGLPVTRDEIYGYLNDVVFGSSASVSQPLTPLYVLANMLAGFKSPQGSGWNDFLDIIESAIEAADDASVHVLPAMAYRLFKK